MIFCSKQTQQSLSSAQAHSFCPQGDVPNLNPQSTAGESSWQIQGVLPKSERSPLQWRTTPYQSPKNYLDSKFLLGDWARPLVLLQPLLSLASKPPADSFATGLQKISTRLPSKAPDWHSTLRGGASKRRPGGSSPPARTSRCQAKNRARPRNLLAGLRSWAENKLDSGAHPKITFARDTPNFGVVKPSPLLEHLHQRFVVGPTFALTLHVELWTSGLSRIPLSNPMPEKKTKQLLVLCRDLQFEPSG